MMIGAISAVLRYDVFACLLSALLTKIFGAPLLFFFDGFGGIAPVALPQTSLQTFAIFRSKPGAHLQIPK